MNLANEQSTEPSSFVNTNVAEQHRLVFTREKFVELYRQAVDSTDQRIDLMAQACEEADFRAIKNHAEALSGLCKNFGFPCLHQVVSKIEVCVEQEDSQKISAKIAELKEVRSSTFKKLKEVVPSI